MPHISKKTVQNELISCCGELITKTLCEEVRDSKFFSVLADEAQDCSNKEQMPVIIRFVDKDKEIREEFFRFMLCDSGVSSEALAKVIKDSVKEIGLDMKNCRGQGYDGAGNMAASVQVLLQDFVVNIRSQPIRIAPLTS